MDTNISKDDISKQITNIFQDAVTNRTFHPAILGGNWKSSILNLQEIITDYGDLDIFTKDAIDGIDYLYNLIFNRISCVTCNDAIPFAWLHNYSIAWVNKKELPIFHHICDDEWHEFIAKNNIFKKDKDKED